MSSKSWFYWSLAGLLVPVFVMTVSWLNGLFKGDLLWVHEVSIFLWPSSFFLMALQWDGLTSTVVFIYAISIGINVIMYAAMGALFNILKSFRYTDQSNIQSTIKYISITYAILGVGGFFAIPLFLSYAYGPIFLRLLDDSFHLNILPLFSILNAIFSFMIAASFWNLKRFGRYIAVAYNGGWLVTLVAGYIVSRVTGPPSDDLGGVPILLLVYFIFPATIIVLCLRADVKKLISK